MLSFIQQFPGALPGGGTTLTAATEVPYFQTPASIQVTDDPTGIVLRGMLVITAAAGTTSVAIKCRRGTGIAGAQVGNTFTITTAASATVAVPFAFLDPATAPYTAPALPSPLYTITVTAAGANATAVDGQLEFMEPEPLGVGV